MTATDSINRPGKNERRGDASCDRKSIAIVVRVQTIERSKPWQGETLEGVDVLGALKCWGRNNSDVRMNIDDASVHGQASQHSSGNSPLTLELPMHPIHS